MNISPEERTLAACTGIVQAATAIYRRYGQWRDIKNRWIADGCPFGGRAREVITAQVEFWNSLRLLTGDLFKWFYTLEEVWENHNEAITATAPRRLIKGFLAGCTSSPVPQAIALPDLLYDREPPKVYRSLDHPEANGRVPNPEAKESGWRFRFPLEDGSLLFVEVGREGREAIRDVLAQEDADTGGYPYFSPESMFPEMVETIHRLYKLALNQPASAEWDEATAGARSILAIADPMLKKRQSG